jgi:hypothetical protein
MNSKFAAIRALFLEPKPTYSLADAAALLGMQPREMQERLVSGELEGVCVDGVLVLPWAELVSFGMDFWSQEVVEEALKAELAAAIPELLRLDDFVARLPRIEIVALERLAARDGISRNAALSRELRDVMSAHSEWLSAEVPGFAAALRWPG